MTPVIVGKRPTRETERTNCTVCGVKTDIPVDEIHYRESATAQKTRMFQATRPFCDGCGDLYANRALPVHPWWCRRGKDGAS